MKITNVVMLIAAMLAGLPALPAGAANIAVTNVALKSRMYAGKVAYIQFDIK